MNRSPMADSPRGRKRKLPRPVRISLGVLLLLGGIAGLVLPVLQGVLMITAGLAEIAAGSIAMGLGGYLAARSDAEHYASERRREEQEVVRIPEVEKLEVAQVFASYGLTEAESAPVIAALSARPQAWVDFMMRFELGLEEPQSGRALRSALTIALAYTVGGLIPLSPYFCLSSAHRALFFSIVVTLVGICQNSVFKD